MITSMITLSGIPGDINFAAQPSSGADASISPDIDFNMLMLEKAANFKPQPTIIAAKTPVPEHNIVAEASGVDAAPREELPPTSPYISDKAESDAGQILAIIGASDMPLAVPPTIPVMATQITGQVPISTPVNPGVVTLMVASPPPTSPSISPPIQPRAALATKAPEFTGEPRLDPATKPMAAALFPDQIPVQSAKKNTLIPGGDPIGNAATEQSSPPVQPGEITSRTAISSTRQVQPDILPADTAQPNKNMAIPPPTVAALFNAVTGQSDLVPPPGFTPISAANFLSADMGKTNITPATQPMVSVAQEVAAVVPMPPQNDTPIAPGVDALSSAVATTETSLPVQLPPALQPNFPSAIPITVTASIPGQSVGDQVIHAHVDMAHDALWMDRLAKDIAQLSGSDGKLKFQLNPENLGSLHIEMAQGSDGTALRFTAETEMARAAIADAQQRLIAEARAQGMRISESHVDLNPSQNGAGQNNRQPQNAPNSINTHAEMMNTGDAPLRENPARHERFA